ncbi:MAG: outer membrane beta-barrel protein [Rhizobiaceae bacterium]
MNIHTFTLPALFIAGTLVISTSSLAADAVLQEDPTPPEPPVEESIEQSGWYIAARIGAAFADDTSFTATGAPINGSYDLGYSVSGAIGYDFKGNAPLSFRTELELGYLALEIDQQNVVGTGTFSGANASGSSTALIGLVNAYVDYELGSITPFATAGVGYASLNFDNHRTTPTGVVMNDSDQGLAWQFGLGAAYAVTDTVKLDVGYRYMGIEDINLTATDATQSSVDLRTHQIRLGIRKAF